MMTLIERSGIKWVGRDAARFEGGQILDLRALQLEDGLCLIFYMLRRSVMIISSKSDTKTSASSIGSINPNLLKSER